MPSPTRGTTTGRGLGTKKFDHINAAEKQQAAIEDQCHKHNIELPNFKLIELIGKGAYGRVYKSRNTANNEIVAVKIIDTEGMDTAAQGPAQGIKDTLKEINILRRLQGGNVVNVNKLITAFGVLTSLWIVSEYCPGGSLTTLRRTGVNKLPEHFIKPVARELARALESVHAAGIVHRDVKCSNVMIHENGSLQLIDFGVAGLLETNMEVDKRTTIVGTLHWMPPEMQKDVPEVRHSFEVDVWSFGITLYECATGAPPNAQKTGRQLQQAIRKEKVTLNRDKYSEELCDLVEFACELDPQKRPTMTQICNHKYIAGSAETHPTSDLKALVEYYYKWRSEGGVRASILDSSRGAEALEFDDGEEGDDWNFSYTEKFEKRMSVTPDELDRSFKFPASDDEDEPFDEATAKRTIPHTAGDTAELDVDKDFRTIRGKQALQGVFDEEAPAYQYRWDKSDLPLRAGDGSSSFHRKELSVNSNNGQPTISLNSPPKQAKRDTQNWTFADNQPPPLPETKPESKSEGPSETFKFPSGDDFAPARPPLKHAATMPVGQVERPVTMDLDELWGSDPPTTQPIHNTGISSDSLNRFDPARRLQSYDFDDPLDSFEADMADMRTMRPSMYSGMQSDLDAGFANFDQPRPSYQPYVNNEEDELNSFQVGPPSDTLPSQVSTRLPSPEPDALHDMNLPNSPPPASPPEVSASQILPSQAGPSSQPNPAAAGSPQTDEFVLPPELQGDISMSDVRRYFDAIEGPVTPDWRPRPPGPETAVPNPSDAVMLHAYYHQCWQADRALRQYEDALNNHVDPSEETVDEEDEEEDDEAFPNTGDESDTLGFGSMNLNGGLPESDGDVEESE